MLPVSRELVHNADPKKCFSTVYSEEFGSCPHLVQNSWNYSSQEEETEGFLWHHRTQRSLKCFVGKKNNKFKEKIAWTYECIHWGSCSDGRLCKRISADTKKHVITDNRRYREECNGCEEITNCDSTCFEENYNSIHEVFLLIVLFFFYANNCMTIVQVGATQTTAKKRSVPLILNRHFNNNTYFHWLLL